MAAELTPSRAGFEPERYFAVAKNALSAASGSFMPDARARDKARPVALSAAGADGAERRLH